MILLLAIILLSVVLDQVTKHLAVEHLMGEASFPIIKDVFHLTYVENEGAAFGMLSDNRWVFMIISTIGIVALAVYLFKFPPKSQFACISLAMIIGGGIGNMIDRVRLEYVIDFLDFTLIDFPVFNIADSFVTVGGGMLLAYAVWDLIMEIRREKAEKAKGTPDEDEHHDA